MTPPMDIDVKICGISTAAARDAALAGGASHLGFIFFEKSPRNLSVGDAATIVRERGAAKAVAVTVDAEDAFLDAIVATMRPDLLQLHGRETPARVAALKQRHGLPVIKALAVRDCDDLSRALTYADCADVLLLDAKAPASSELPGGNGVSFDWSLVSDFRSPIPVLLSGGIDLGNVEAACSVARDVRNDLVGLDVSSGVESAPGVKSSAKITDLLSACRPPADPLTRSDGQGSAPTGWTRR